MTTEKRVIWAVDLFNDEGRLTATVPGTLTALAKSLPCSIEPVCVVDRSNLPDELDALSTEHATVRFSSHARLNHWQKSVSMPGMHPLNLLVADGGSPGVAAARIADYARDCGADLIVVHSHARAGLSRFLKGSFAESLVHLAPVPVIVSNPSTIAGDRFEEILFPTGFSELSSEIFDVVTDLTAEMGGRLELLHEIEDLYPLMSPMDFGTPVEPAYDAQLLTRTAELSSDVWKARAEAKGVPLHYQVRAGTGDRADTILDVSRRLASPLIVLTCSSGLLSACVLGSTSHSVLRNATCPVMIIHCPGRVAKAA